jgi:RHS repeat-associated protein
MGQRLLRSGVVGFVSGAVVAAVLVGASAPAVGALAPTATPVTADRAVSAQAESVGPIATVSGSGTAFPAGPLEVAVMPDGGVSSGVRPFLAVPRLMGEPSDMAVRVVDASLPGAPVQWSGRLKDGWGRIDATLVPGGAYRVEGSDDGAKWATLGWLVVRGAWNAGGSDVAVGAVTVSQVSGGVSWGWSSGGSPGPVGTGAVSVGWSSGWSVPSSLRVALPAGLPVGWRLAVGSGSPWASLLLSEQDGIARVVGWDGSVLVFQRNPSDVWVQVTGGAPGFSNELSKVDAGTWEFVSAEGVSTRFAGEKGVFRASKVFSGGRQISTASWDAQQRIASVTNEVGRVLTLTYAGSGSCESDGWSESGWAKVPEGLLCEIAYPDGTSTEFGYVGGVAGAAQIGLVKDPGNVATTLGWDSKARLVSERGSFANRVAPVDAAAKAIVTSVSYDSTGRATALRMPSRAVQKLTFPSVDEQVLKAWVVDRDRATSSAQVSVKSTLTAGEFELSKTSYLDPTSWVTLRAQDSTGAQMRMVTDERGRVSKQIDSLGRVTTYAYNDLGLVTGTTGPSIDTKAPQTSQEFDTRGTPAKKDDLVGLRALVGSGANRVPEFWAATSGKGGVSYSWSGRPAVWAGQATGIWDPSRADRDAADAAGGWSFQVKSEGADVTLRVNGRVCEPDSAGVCDLGDIGGGLEQVTVGIDRGQARGFFQVLAGPRGGKLTEIPGSAVAPGFGLVTESATNDTFPGRTQQPLTTSTFADPSSGQPSQVTSPGGLVSKYTYESSGWERLSQVTTAGGATQKTTYWPSNGTATLPTVCGGGQVKVSGQPKSVTRQDGMVVTSWPDLSGRVVAAQILGREGATQTTCTSFFADGTVESSAFYDSQGQLVERSVTDPAVGGDYRISRTTTSKGPGAGDVTLEQVWAQSRTNLLGQVVEATGSSGITSTSSYNALGLPATVTTTASDGTALTMAYAYRTKDAQVSSVTVNGVKAAVLQYDSFDRVSAVTYPGGVSLAYSYDGGSRAIRQTVRAGELNWTHSLERTSFGRILSGSMESGSAKEQRAYAYDPGTGRLTKATVTSGGATTTYGYSFGKQDASCPRTDYNPGADGLRSGGSRNGAAYVTCHDGAGRAISTTDPLVTGGAGSASITHDDFGRVVSISGADPVDISWGLGASMTRLVQGGDDTAVIEMEDFGGQTILRTVTTAAGAQSVRYAGPFTVSTDATGAPGAVIATQYALPCGVQVSVQGGTATATIPDLDGSAMATIAIPVLAGKSNSNGPLVAAARFGPYGEPLTAPAGGDAVKDYTWRSEVGLETLPGSASITIMGARPYHPGLGEFLTPDPRLDGGDALYAYTSGDPINFRDPSGGSEEPDWTTWLAAIGGGLLAIVAGTAAYKAGTATSLAGAKAATWIAGIAGAAAVAGGGYLAATSSADSDTAFFAAGIAIAAVGGLSAVAGIARGVKNVKTLRWKRDFDRNPIAAEIREDWQFEYMDAKNLEADGWLGGQAQASNVGSEARGSIVRSRSSAPQAIEVPANALDAVDGGAVQVSKPLSGAMDPAGIAADERAFAQKWGGSREEAIDYTKGRFQEAARAGDFDVMMRMFDFQFKF